MRLLTQWGYLVDWEMTEDGRWYVAGFSDPLNGVMNLEDGGYVWVADEGLRNVQAIHSSIVTTAFLVQDDTLPNLSR